ncbi:hemerythrin domain-containing protein [Aquincola sp. J276]|uniref:hemerythrin domain-containing protein n=1 Tax=Aquincola sp. J276 TaxID=2898432 RepID=UPI0021511E1B|nr:hemerythrin domain-containing protein [Aquincola sp. J276]MCR5864064.1 hemerythrin domain-containing protein [Aquincola sp. J276]
MTMPAVVPGFEASAVSFDQPFEMLGACHERTRRSCQLLVRLTTYLSDHEIDELARQAATDVLRYFTLAAPQHHKDEELHVVPLLRASGDAKLTEVAERILSDHRKMENGWRGLAPLLEAVVPGATRQLATLAAAVEGFVLLHNEHLTLEEAWAFPAARAFQSHLGPNDLANMGEEMAARRVVHRSERSPTGNLTL